MIVSYDTEAGATYVELLHDERVVRTVSLSDLVMVDVSEHGEPIGVEFVVPPAKITEGMLHSLAAFPALKEMAYNHDWLLTHA